MNLKDIIKTFYVIYTIYIILVISITNIKFFDIFPAILLMWLTYIFFNLGYVEKQKNNVFKPQSRKINRQSKLLTYKKSTLFLIAFLSIIFSILATKFYTGQTPFNVINGLLNDNSLYYEYQNYFSSQQLNSFSVSKLPYIFMLFYIKITLFYSFIVFLSSKKKLLVYERIYLFLLTFAHIYFGIARGTNFELFELLILTIFLLLLKSNNNKRKIKYLSISFIVGCLMIFIYYNVVAARGFSFDYNISRDIRYNQESLLNLISPELGFIILILFDYLGFGFFYIATYISEIWFSSFTNIVAGLSPLGFKLSRNTSIQNMMSTQIDMGARWVPDNILIINQFGFIGLLIICFFLGRFAKKCYKKGNGAFSYLTYFVILLEMLSLPVGNFLFVSSAGILIVIYLVSYWLWKYYIKIKIIF